MKPSPLCPPAASNFFLTTASTKPSPLCPPYFNHKTLQAQLQCTLIFCPHEPSALPSGVSSNRHLLEPESPSTDQTGISSNWHLPPRIKPVSPSVALLHSVSSVALLHGVSSPDPWRSRHLHPRRSRCLHPQWSRCLPPWPSSSSWPSSPAVSMSPSPTKPALLRGPPLLPRWLSSQHRPPFKLASQTAFTDGFPPGFPPLTVPLTEIFDRTAFTDGFPPGFPPLNR